MSQAPSEQELQELFEQVWQLAELAAGSDDRHLAPHLFELAKDIAWGTQREGDAATPSVARPQPKPIDAAQDIGIATLGVMAERLSRQRMIISRMERIGDRPSIELAYQLLRLMQQSMDVARYGLAVLDAFDRRPTPVGV